MKTFFEPFRHRSLHLRNRFVMAPMTRSFSPGGVPSAEVAAYYRRRAEGEVGLIITEGTVINRPASSNDANIPHFHGEAALRGWGEVVREVHAANGLIAPQLWHMGVMQPHASGWLPPTPFEGPSGLLGNGEIGGVAMTEADIAATIAAFAEAARSAKALGFDALELHGAHGYLIDQFFWSRTNRRTDRYGGSTIAERNRFALDVITAVRDAVGPDFTLLLRLSQWKPSDYTARIATTPQELEAWVAPLAEAGVDLFHCSQRRFWEPEFEGSDLNFAGWVKKITGKPTITVGSVGLSGDFIAGFAGETSTATPLESLHQCFERGDFDLVAVGRALITDPAWVRKLREGEERNGFDPAALRTLV